LAHRQAQGHFHREPRRRLRLCARQGWLNVWQGAGFEVTDYGDCAPRLFADDEEHRRARNLTAIVAGLNDLKTRAEVAMKSGALVLVLGGECVQAIGLADRRSAILQAHQSVLV